MTYIDDSVKQTEIFEGRVAWMYLDTKGLVTCAVGLQLATAPAATQLDWYIAQSEFVPATRTQILADWYRVKSLEAGHIPAYYKGQLEMDDETIDSLLRTTIRRCDSDLRLDFPLYDTFSDSRKIALIDMRYNLGNSRLVGTYPNFDAAVRSGDWNQAIAECGRDESVKAFAARNEWTQNMLAIAA